MGWLIPFVLFVISVWFWRLSHKADDLLVAWCRFLIFILMLALAILFAVIEGCSA